jgi:hypothetical protein
VAEHNTESSHGMKFRETEALVKLSGYMARLVREAVEMKLRPDNINREEGFKLNKAWNPSTSLLRHSNAHTPGKPQEHTEGRAYCKEDNIMDSSDTRLSDMVIG